MGPVHLFLHGCTGNDLSAWTTGGKTGGGRRGGGGEEGKKMIVLNLSLILSRVRTMKDVNTGEEPEEKPLPVFYQNTSKKKAKKNHFSLAKTI